MANVVPVELTIVEDGSLQIGWSDGQDRRYTIRELRDQCPCATCRVKRNNATQGSGPESLLPVLLRDELEPLRILRMTPAGTYAYTIAFSDEHHTGIYTIDLLRTLGRAVQ